MSAPQVEPDADAEAIFWEVRVLDELDGSVPRTVVNHYIRIKIFTERGRETQSRIDIPYFSGDRISDIAGRTIKPDGSITELNRNDIHERTIVRANGVRLKAKSFAMPGVEPGAIIEYRWRETRNDELANYIRLRLQRDIPVQTVRYFIKPLSHPLFPFNMRIRTFNGQNAPFTRERGGFHSMTLTNVPAFRPEPRMPPEDQMRSWMLVYYSPDRSTEPTRFWRDYGKEVYEQYRSSMRVNDEVRRAAAEAVGDATTDDQKLERLFRYVRTRIRNISYDPAFTAEERRRIARENSAADTLRRGTGTMRQINMLFAALAAAAGYDARVALLADRSDIFFDPDFPDAYFLTTYDIAVRVGDQWRFFDPGSLHIPYGMLRWREEGQQALVTDPREPVWVRTPLSPPERSQHRRTATLRLSADGTLEGEIKVELTGHIAADMRLEYATESATTREQMLRESITSRLSAAEVTDLRIENLTDSEQPLVYSYRVRVPGYAQRTGRRLFIQPAYFQRGIGPLFQTGARRFPIYFNYPWSESDSVTIDLPAGYALDNASQPAPITADNITRHEVKIQLLAGDRSTLSYSRYFFFGGGGNILFQTSSYPVLKQIFDLVNESDNHTIALLQQGAGSSN